MNESYPYRERNRETLKAWVERASQGFLTVTRFTDSGVLSGCVSIGRTDGMPLDGKQVSPSWSEPVTAVCFGSIYVSDYRPIDRRFKTVAQAVRDAVRYVLVGYIDDAPLGAYSGLSSFEWWTKIGA